VLDDLGIRVPHREAGEAFDLRDEFPVVVDRVVDAEPERFPSS